MCSRSQRKERYSGRYEVTATTDPLVCQACMFSIQWGCTHLAISNTVRYRKDVSAGRNTQTVEGK